MVEQINPKPLQLKKPVQIIHMDSSNIKHIQKKLLNLALWNYYKKGNLDDEIQTIELRVLHKYLRYQKSHNDYILKELKNLAVLMVEWNLLEDGKARVGFTTLLAGAEIVDNGILEYSFSPQLRKILKDRDIYQNLNLTLSTLFDSKYSANLYENCVRFVEIGNTGWWEISLFRKLLGVKANQYADFKRLKDKVIAPTIEEVNRISEITVKEIYRRTGRKVSHVRFEVKRKPPSVETLAPVMMKPVGEVDDSLKFEKMQLEKIIDVINEMPIPDREKLVKRFLADHKKNPIIMSMYRKEGFTAFLVQQRFDWFEERVLK